MKLDREILPIQVRDLLRQLMQNGILNADFPVFGSGRNWIEHLEWGPPGGCSKPGPFLFVYGFEVSEQQVTLCGDRVTVRFVLGVQANCKQVEGTRDEFEKMAYKIFRFWGINAPSWELPGSYTVTASDASTRTYSNANLGDFGIRNTASRTPLELTIDTGAGKAYRRSASIEFELSFAHVGPKVGRSGPSYSGEVAGPLGSKGNPYEYDLAATGTFGPFPIFFAAQENLGFSFPVESFSIKKGSVSIVLLGTPSNTIRANANISTPLEDSFTFASPNGYGGEVVWIKVNIAFTPA